MSEQVLAKLESELSSIEKSIDEKLVAASSSKNDSWFFRAPRTASGQKRREEYRIAKGKVDFVPQERDGLLGAGA